MSINESHRCRPPLNTSDMVGLVGNSISGNALVSMSLKRSVGRLVVSSNIIRRTCLKMAEPRVWCAHVSSYPILLITETTINKEKSARAENISVCVCGESADRKETEEFTDHPSKSKDAVEEYLITFQATSAHRSKSSSSSLLRRTLEKSAIR